MGWPSTHLRYAGSPTWAFASRIPLLRMGALLGLGIVALPLYWLALQNSSTINARPFGFFWPELGLSLVAVLGAWLVLTTTPAPTRRTRTLELAAILLLGGAFRLLAFPSLPALSHDAYRYVWDAHLVAHGVSPYVHPVTDPALAPLRDRAIWPNVNWRDAVTIYPPGAQLFFLAVHAVAPLNIWAMKAAVELCDVLAGVVTLLLLRQRSMDPRRVILYWWSPIPVVEFAANAHIDAAAVLWLLVALLLVNSALRPARLGAGIFLGLAVLTKLYPLIFALALLRRRNWSFVLGLAATLVLAYLPFIRLGLGGGGFLGTYISQRFVDQGILFRLLGNLAPKSATLAALLGLAAVLLCGAVAYTRWRGAISVEASLLALSAVWIVLSPHLFPWYVAGVLPLLALMPTVRGRSLLSLPLPALAFWLFVLLMPFTYVVFAPHQTPEIFQIFFVVPLAMATIPLALALRRRLSGLPVLAPVD